MSEVKSIKAATEDLKDLKNRSTETLEEEIAKLREDVVSIAATLKHIASDAANIAVDAAKDKFEKASSEAKAAAGNSKAAVEKTVVDHPFTTVLIALGLGFLIGTWVRR